MQPLKLPTYKPTIRHQDRKEIFCLVRKKFVALTPEEWVRQHFLNLLIAHLGYPKGMIKLEQSMNYFKNLKRSDITVLDKTGSAFLLVECKSFEIKLSKSAVKQVSEYNKVIDARFIAISNGIKHFIWERKEGAYAALNEFPNYH